MKIMKEVWECNECGTPCRIEILYSDDKLPTHLKKGMDHFRDRRCFCREQTSNWKRLEDLPPSQQGVEADRQKLCGCQCHGTYKFWRQCCGRAGIEQPAT